MAIYNIVDYDERGMPKVRGHYYTGDDRKPWLRQWANIGIENVPTSQLYRSEQFVRAPDIYGYAQEFERRMADVNRQSAGMTRQMQDLLLQAAQLPNQYRPQMMQAFANLGAAIQGASSTLGKYGSPQSFRAQVDPLLEQYSAALFGAPRPASTAGFSPQMQAAGVLGQNRVRGIGGAIGGRISEAPGTPLLPMYGSQTSGGIAGQRQSAVSDFINAMNAAQAERERFASGQLADISKRASDIAVANAMRSANLFGAAMGTGGAGTSLASLASRAALEASLPFQQRWAETMLNVLGGRSNVAGAELEAKRYGIEGARQDIADLLGRRLSAIDYSTRLAPIYTQEYLRQQQALADLPRQQLAADLGLRQMQLEALQGAQTAGQSDYLQALRNLGAWIDLRNLGLEDVIRANYPTYAGIPMVFF